MPLGRTSRWHGIDQEAQMQVSGAAKVKNVCSVHKLAHLMIAPVWVLVDGQGNRAVFPLFLIFYKDTGTVAALNTEP
jgi:hypothetical protein